MQLKLDDKSRLIFRWLDTGQLAIERWAPGKDRFGHGIIYQGRCVLSGEELTALFAFLSQQPTSAEAA